MKRWIPLTISKKSSFFPYFPYQSRKTSSSFSFTFVLDSFGLFYGDFCMDLYCVDLDEAMKRGDEALNASSLQFLSIVKRFIASSLQFLSPR